MKLLWSTRMAWRDSRGSRTRLLVFMVSLTLGVAALVSINSFGDNLQRAIDEQAASLLGADISIESDRPFTEDDRELMAALDSERSQEISFSSMALFPSLEASRLVSVRAMEGGYPYYGTLETDPAPAAAGYLESGGALIDGTLAAQFDLAPGDSIKIGDLVYKIEGLLRKVPRESAVFSVLSPRVYIPLNRLDRDLLTYGSRAEYTMYFKLGESFDVEGWLEANEARLDALGLGTDTIQEEKENWSEVLTNIYRFLALTGFIALLLGSLGIASAVYVYVRQRRGTVALLRCLGSTNRDAAAIYLTQAIAMGLVGSLAGIIAGAGVQLLVPKVLGDFIPVEVSFSISVGPIVQGLATGVIVTALFALVPLMELRKISAMGAIRASALSSENGDKRDYARIGIFLAALAGVTAFSIVQAPTPIVGLLYVAGLVTVFGLLVLSAKGVLYVARKLSSRTARYTLKQSIANLQRPNNQTSIMMLAIGFGTFLIAAMFFIQNNLVNQIEFADQGNRPNTIFFDIQTDQIAGVENILESEGYPVAESVPLVSMRIESINGRSIEELEEADESTWAHSREYRSTYRNFLTEAEDVIRGEFIGSHPEDGHLVPVSMEEGLVEELNIDLGDTVTFDVQGVPVETVISSIRLVDWQRVQTNFFFVFPDGVLESAPKIYVAVTRVPSEEASGMLQTRVVSAYPNVSAIDLRLILSVFEEIFGRISFVLKFMAFFSMATGLIIVGGSVFVSRYYRVQESVLLRTLGASKSQINQIIAGEYIVLGLIASVAGVLLALIGSSLVSRFVFETDVYVPVQLVVVTVVVVVAVTLLVGLVNSRGITTRPPLDVLRKESI